MGAINKCNFYKHSKNSVYGLKLQHYSLKEATKDSYNSWMSQMTSHFVCLMFQSLLTRPCCVKLPLKTSPYVLLTGIMFKAQSLTATWIHYQSVIPSHFWNFLCISRQIVTRKINLKVIFYYRPKSMTKPIKLQEFS